VEAQLRSLGHECESARDGRAAWRLLLRHDHRLVVSDCMMPGLTGLELVRRIRTRPRAPYVYVILLTALGEREDRLLGLETGADDLLPKPVDLELLAARLEVAARILRSARAR
jgi:DNA-binding response OmpR family regulator